MQRSAASRFRTVDYRPSRGAVESPRYRRLFRCGLTADFRSSSCSMAKRASAKALSTRTHPRRRSTDEAMNPARSLQQPARASSQPIRGRPNQSATVARSRRPRRPAILKPRQANKCGHLRGKYAVGQTMVAMAIRTSPSKPSPAGNEAHIFGTPASTSRHDLLGHARPSCSAQTSRVAMGQGTRPSASLATWTRSSLNTEHPTVFFRRPRSRPRAVEDNIRVQRAAAPVRAPIRTHATAP